MDHVAVLVGQHLDLHVLGAAEVLLDEDLVVAEGLLGLVDGLLELLVHVGLFVHDTHTAAAAAVGGLQHDGVAHLGGHFLGLLGGLHGVVHAGDDGNVGGDGDLLGGDLVAHGVHGVHGGADEGDAVALAGLHQVGVLCQEAVAGVDGVHAVLLGDLDDGLDVQIGIYGAGLGAQGIGLVRDGAEHGVLVLLGVDGHGGDAQLVQSPEHTDGDLAAVGDQDSLEGLDSYFTHKRTPFLVRKSKTDCLLDLFYWRPVPPYPARIRWSFIQKILYTKGFSLASVRKEQESRFSSCIFRRALVQTPLQKRRRRL